MKVAIAVAVVLILVLAGFFLFRGGGGAAVTADTTPFEAAITRYLDAHSMGMKVAGFKSLELTGDTATAVCSMQEKSGLYGGMAVKWRFTFRRGADGAWQVEGRQQL